MGSASHAHVLGSATVVKKLILTLKPRTVDGGDVVQSVSHSGAILVARPRSGVEGCAKLAVMNTRDYSVSIVVSLLRMSHDATSA